MTTTFADYVATQEQRENVSNDIVKYTKLLIEALKNNYIQYSIRGHQRSIENLNYTYETTDSVESNYHQEV